MLAVRNNNREVCQVLLELGGADPNIGGYTPLFIAAEAGHKGIVKLLLERRGAKLGSSNKHGQTPLMMAVRGQEGIVKLLERKGIKLGSSDEDGRILRRKAASNGHESIVKLFLERKKVSPNPCDWEGDTPLSLATGINHKKA